MPPKTMKKTKTPKTKTIRQTVTFKVAPKEVYESLMDQKKHARFTGAPAKISRKVGGAFSAYGGYCFGINLEIIENKKIVQSWQGRDWTEEELSKVSFAFSPAKSGGTKLTFTQTGVPVKHYPHIKQGWKDHYWIKLQAMLAAKPPLKASR